MIKVSEKNSEALIPPNPFFKYEKFFRPFEISLVVTRNMELTEIMY